MTKEEKYSIAKWAMEHALKNGAQQARVIIYNNNSSQIEVREKKIDKLQESNRNGMRINLYVDKKYSSISTNRITNKEEMAKFIEEAITGTRYLSEDEFRSLPDPERYYKGGGPDLHTLDPGFSSVDPQQKINDAFAIEKEVLGADERIISVSTSYSDGMSGSVMVASNGFEGDTENTYYSLNASVSVTDGVARPRGGWNESAIFIDELIRKDIGKKALKRALDRLGQAKIESGKMPMIVENKMAGRALQPMISALNGGAIQQKQSFLIGMKGEQIGSDLMTIMDDPFLVSGRGSRLFDSEGMATEKRSVIEKGILKTYYIDTYYAKKLEMEATSGETTNLIFKPGEKDLEGLLADIERGILVTGFNGGNSNSATGDFSFGIEGFLVEKGKLIQAVAEMNITGNFRQLWKDLVAVGSDVDPSRSWRLPSLVFDNVDFSGI
ncbi:MAG: TldD/PmbA family protein [Bacteroidales bacterium]|nr:TldD/PmbA family protein [Bacteroidales bacterium]